MLAYLGLGANLADPRAQIEAALERLQDPPRVRVLRRAPYYRTKPVGPPGQPDYLNTAAEIEVELPPEDLLGRVKAIEAALGRTPGVRWGPRIIDVDILMYGSRIVAAPDLVIPHPELHRRRFALAPLADLAPDLVVPGIERTVRALLLDLEDDPSSVIRERP